MYSVLNSSYNFFMVVNFIAHMVHSPPNHNDCFVNKINNNNNNNNNNDI